LSGPAIGTRFFKVYAVADEELDCIQVTIFGGCQEWRSTSFVRTLYVGACLDDELHSFQVTDLDGHEQSCGAVFGWIINFDAGIS